MRARRYVPAYPVAEGRCPHCGQEWQQWTAARVLAAIRAAAAASGFPPKRDQWKNATPDRPGSRTVVRMFGSWSRAIVAAGLAPRPQGGQATWTRDSIITAFGDYARGSGGAPPSAVEWQNPGAGYPCSATVIRLFGTWNTAIEEAGFYPRGPYGQRLKIPAGRSPRRYVASAPIADALRDYLGETPSIMFAELVGMDPSGVQRILRGDHKSVSIDTAEIVLGAIGREDVLVGLEETLPQVVAR